MFNCKVLSVLLALGLPTLAFSQTPVKKPIVKEAAATATPDKAAGKDEADQVITNRRLRAETGSLSKWSGSLYFNYSGGSVADPLRPNRPNIVAGADALTLQNFSGDLGVRYRITALDSVTASTGVFMSTPFHTTIDTNNPELKEDFEKNKQDVTFSDPALKYTHLDSVLGLQSVTTLAATLITNPQQTKQGYDAAYTISQTFMKEFGKTGFSLGGSFQWTKYTFAKTNQNLAENLPGFYPAAEYVINDLLNLRTVFGWQVYQQTRAQDHDTYTKRKVYQSVGLGISLSRDVFLYPNIQFIPSDIRSDRTNVAISANINVF
jgi:hypothetical protein